MPTKPKAVLFDLGETLFEPLPKYLTEKNLIDKVRLAGSTAGDDEIVSHYSERRSEIAREFASTSFYLHRDLIASAFKRCCESLGCESSAELVNAFCAVQRENVVQWLRPRPDCFTVMEELTNQGFLLGVVSNIDNDYLEPLTRAWDLKNHFKFLLSSETAGSCKPHELIFKLGCQLIQCKPQEVTFVGDDEVNDIQGARANDMTSVRFLNQTSERSDQTSQESANPETSADYVIDSLSALLALPVLR